LGYYDEVIQTKVIKRREFFYEYHILSAQSDKNTKFSRK